MLERGSRTSLRCAVVLGTLLTGAFTPSEARAFWVLNFSTGQTLDPGRIGFIGGTGGQLTVVGEPLRLSYTPFLAHAGIRVGLFDGVDVGYRMVTVPLPWTSVGPTLGAASDLKVRLTHESSPWQVAIIGGGAFAYLRVFNDDHLAWSPGADLIITRVVSDSLSVSGNARYVFTAIPSAPGGIGANSLHAFGPSVGMRIGLTGTVSVHPEIGVFRFIGEIGGIQSDGIGMQYGAVLSTMFD
jgi:hypothetical protein